MKRSRKSLGMAILFAMLISMFPAGMALAQPDSGPITVDTNAVVDGNNASAPTVTLKWELQTVNRDQNQLGPWSADVIVPNLHDDPLAYIGYWWVASHPAGIAAITEGFVNVFHPDGTHKYQLHGVVKPCSDLGNENTEGSLLWAAVQTGQITALEAQQLRGDCDQNQVKIFHVFGEISKHQPCGIYRVEATAQDQFGAIHTLVNEMEVGCIVGLALDFTAVDYGQIVPETPKWIDGDWVFQAGSKPTAMNTGNIDAFLGYHPLQMVGVQFGKPIDLFDLTIRWRVDPTDTNEVALTQTFDPIPASTLVCFDQIPIGPNEIVKIDHSIHPPSLLPQDTYVGTAEYTLWIFCP